MLIVVICCAVWLTVGLPVGLLLGRALRRADSVDRRPLASSALGTYGSR
ncbi:hypothetical protein ACI8AA_14930 [Geodermatophilus sp. SYSU D01180]